MWFIYDSLDYFICSIIGRDIFTCWVLTLYSTVIEYIQRVFTVIAGWSMSRNVDQIAQALQSVLWIILCMHTFVFLPLCHQGIDISETLYLWVWIVYKCVCPSSHLSCFLSSGYAFTMQISFIECNNCNLILIYNHTSKEYLIYV